MPEWDCTGRDMTPEEWNNKGIALYTLERYEEAIEAYNKGRKVIILICTYNDRYKKRNKKEVKK